ncbi:hypothetical protein JCM8202_006310 [Rhodotorula sphaerocarpa]
MEIRPHRPAAVRSAAAPSTRRRRRRPGADSTSGFARTLGAVGVAAAALWARVPLGVEAYIPAQPVNDTSALNSSNDILHLFSYQGVFDTYISRQLIAQAIDNAGNYTNVTTIVPWTRFSKGVLIHFNESLRGEPPATVPWIAMINCDTNGTSYSDTDDIFTITRDRGAQAALLYSLTSQGCQINPDYLANFDHVLDVYATTSLSGSRIIENQFNMVPPDAWAYNSSVLNASSSAIEQLLSNNALSVVGNVPTNASLEVPTSSAADPVVTGVFGSGAVATSADMTPPSLFSETAPAPSLQRRQQTSSARSSGSATHTSSTHVSATRTAAHAAPSAQNYLGAVMAAANLTVGGLQTASPSASAGTTQSSGDSSGGGGSGASTSLAMIILYSITGVVTVLFLIVIMSGAIRAARHPERYGPRAGGGRGAGGGGGRTRAEGLTKAILDTFPVVRFGGGGAGGRNGDGSEAGGRAADEEASTGDGGSVGDESDARKKAASAAETDNIELAVLPTVPATQRDERGDLGARRQSQASSLGGESFRSAPEGPAVDGESIATMPGASAVSTAPASVDEVSAPPPVSNNPAVNAVLAADAAADGSDSSESCPICLTEFEDGDELRILPCDERHRFHSECIDPFLLNVSRLCPLCRLDLGHVSGAAGEEADGHGEGGGGGGASTSERREEERVIRHLRALLLHRPSGNASLGGGPGAAAASMPAGTGATGGAEGADDGAAGNTSRLRNRFAQYVVARRREREERRRFRRGSTSGALANGGAYYGAPPF